MNDPQINPSKYVRFAQNAQAAQPTMRLHPTASAQVQNPYMQGAQPGVQAQQQPLYAPAPPPPPPPGANPNATAQGSVQPTAQSVDPAQTLTQPRKGSAKKGGGWLGGSLSALSNAMGDGGSATARTKTLNGLPGLWRLFALLIAAMCTVISAMVTMGFVTFERAPAMGIFVFALNTASQLFYWHLSSQEGHSFFKLVLSVLLLMSIIFNVLGFHQLAGIQFDITAWQTWVYTVYGFACDVLPEPLLLMAAGYTIGHNLKNFRGRGR